MLDGPRASAHRSVIHVHRNISRLALLRFCGGGWTALRGARRPKNRRTGAPIPLKKSLLFTPGQLKEVGQAWRKVESSKGGGSELGVNPVKGLAEFQSTKNTTMFSILRLKPVNGIFGAFGAFTTTTHSVVKVGRGPLRHLFAVHPCTSVGVPPHTHNRERSPETSSRFPSSILKKNHMICPFFHLIWPFFCTKILDIPQKLPKNRMVHIT